MECPKCGKIGEPCEFTATNRSKDGSRAWCKDCKKAHDTKNRDRKAKKNKELSYFDLKPSLLGIRNKARIGVLIMKNFVDRESSKHKGFHQLANTGLSAILAELGEPYEYCSPEAMNQFEYVLISLTSVMDVENVIYNMEVYAPQERRCKVVIGGFGVINIKLVVPYIDIAVFGRAEGQINDILAGQRFKNVWRKSDDPDVSGNYEVRQPRYLVKGEASVGCRNHCTYCQYTHVRRSIDKAVKYDPGMSVQETDWNGLTVDKAGRYNSAWDGWSDDTRRRVHKPVTAKGITDKLIDIGNRVDGGVNLKIYQIVGYPWDTIESVEQEIKGVISMLRDIDRQIKGKIYLSFLCTPFGPEPLTPMQYEAANITAPWRVALGGRILLDGDHIRAYISPFISGSFLLMKRVMINRAEIGELERFKRVAFSRKLLRLPESLRVPWLIKHEAVTADMFGKVDTIGADNIKIEDRVTQEQSELFA